MAFLFGLFVTALTLTRSIYCASNHIVPDVLDEYDLWNGSWPPLRGYADVHASLQPRAAKQFYLRVMPLGASITEGVGSSDGNGYRKWLRSQLRWKGWQVNMVGGKQNGNMKDNDNQGHPGFIVSEVAQQFTYNKWMKPNLVVLNVGTNDCARNTDPSTAGNRVRALLDDIFNSIPGVTVILSTLAPSRDNSACATDISRQYRNLFNQYGNDTPIALADWQAGLTLNDIGSDGIHPNDGGYKKIAAILWDAISKVEGKIQPPDAIINDTQVTSDQKCEKIPGKARGPIQTQRGSGYDDGKYVHSSQSMGQLTGLKIFKVDNAHPLRVFFAQLTKNDPAADRSASLDDMITIQSDPKGDEETKYFVLQNLGGGKFSEGKRFYINQTNDCDGLSRAFADFNNDGLADFFCIAKDSSVTISLNRGGSPPKFENIGQIVVPHDGYNNDDVRIADIDGDGRADYCLIDHNGDMICSRNGGQEDNKASWQGFQTEGGLRELVSKSRNKGDKTGVRYGDLNGDFRDDWMWIGSKGDIDTYINNRGEGAGIVPNWVGVGITHAGMGVEGVRDQIKLGRIYGSGRLDYIYFKEVKDGWEANVWQNNGAGGTKLKGDGVFYCDMRGTGRDDYVWIYNDGHSADLYINDQDLPNWKIGPRNLLGFGIPGPRIGIHLADWDGDGRCDVLVQDKNTGSLRMWRNDYNPSNQAWKFTDVGTVSGSARCTEGWGVGIFDRGMRLADIDGDGRADYLCLERNARITAWLNTKSGLKDVGQIKFPEGFDRADIRFADVENHGKADMLSLNKYTGAVSVYQNMGNVPAGGGSSFTWKRRGNLYNGVDRGANLHFPKLGGKGRADLHAVAPIANTAATWFNECPGQAGGDDGPLVDPGLPPYQTSPPVNDGNETVYDDPNDERMPYTGTNCPQWPENQDESPSRVDLPLPSIAQIIKYFTKLSPADNTCWFYIGPFRQAAIELARNVGNTLYDIYKDDDDACSPFSEDHGVRLAYQNQGMLRDWFQITSRAYASLCRGTAYFVWDGKWPLINDKNEISIWFTDEFPELIKDGGLVNKIFQVDPLSGVQKLYWERLSKRFLTDQANVTSIASKPAPPANYVESYGMTGTPSASTKLSHISRNGDDGKKLHDENIERVATDSQVASVEEIARRGNPNPNTHEDIEGTYFNLRGGSFKPTHGYIAGRCKIQILQMRTTGTRPTRWYWEHNLFDQGSTHELTTKNFSDVGGAISIRNYLPRWVIYHGRAESREGDDRVEFWYGKNRNRQHWYSDDTSKCNFGNWFVGIPSQEYRSGYCYFDCGPWPYDSDDINP